jgi:single-strand DNA-binding protein
MYMKKDIKMAKSYNKTIIIGRLGQSPELKQSGKTEYTRFSICNSTFKDGQEDVQWHRICAFGRQAQLCHEHLKKGDLCCIEGRLDSQYYEKNGEKRYQQSVIAEKITFLTSRRKAETQNGSNLNEVFANDEACVC